jgi:hypothetical protein
MAQDETKHEHSRYHLLICGRSFQGLAFRERDRAREELRFELLRAGVILMEYVWVWDRTDRAQLLVSSYRDRKRAGRRQNQLEAAGLRCRIVRELPE